MNARNGNRFGRLRNVLSGRPWVKHLRPFPHFTAQDVFVPEAYRAFESKFLELSQSNPQYLKQHDIHGLTVTRETAGALDLFASREWHDLLAGLLEIKVTDHVNLGIHRHEIGSANGFPHNDCNPGWFVEYETEDGIILAQPDLCSYTDGTPRQPGIVPRELVRAAALIYYLANPAWTPTDGGETGLYESASDPPERPYVSVPPLNNSLVAFECTPYSFHGFISNQRIPRNSIVMWLHREKSEMIELWGEDAIIKYRS